MKEILHDHNIDLLIASDKTESVLFNNLIYYIAKFMFHLMVVLCLMPVDIIGENFVAKIIGFQNKALLMYVLCFQNLAVKFLKNHYMMIGPSQYFCFCFKKYRVCVK